MKIFKVAGALLLLQIVALVCLVAYAVSQFGTAVSIVNGSFELATQHKPESNGKNLFIINRGHKFDLPSSEKFAEEISYVIYNSRPGDELLISIDSPGGQALSCGHDYDQVQRLKKADIKVTVTVDYMAASCGYMLSASADHIIVSPSAMVGNIGSVMPMPKPKKPIEMIGTTRAKELMAGATAKSAKDKAILERQAKLMVVPFYKAVFANRKIKPQDIPMVFSAHLFPATMAKDLGLVDELLDKRSVKLRYFMTGYTMVEVNHVSPMTLASALK